VIAQANPAARRHPIGGKPLAQAGTLAHTMDVGRPLIAPAN
jgi:hypothetical protein